MAVHEESPERMEMLRRIAYIATMDGQIKYIMKGAEKRHKGNTGRMIEVHRLLSIRRQNRMKRIGTGDRKR